MLLRKIIRRIKKILSRIVIHNKQYRPNGVYSTIDEYTSAVTNAECIEAFPSYTSTLNFTDDFKSKFIKYVNTTLEAEIPASKVVIIPNGRVHTDNNFSTAIISGDNKLLGELSYDETSPVPAENSIFRQSYFHAPEYYKGTVFSTIIGEGGIVNYSHWLIDSLSRIALLKKIGWYDKIDWFMVPSLKHDFQRDSLKVLGIDESKIIAGDVNNHVQADTLVATTYVRYNEHVPFWCCDFLRNEFLNRRSPEAEKKYNYSYVYISRNDSAKRRVLNEVELMKSLEKKGFVSFELSKLSFQEKISLFANAKVIIATIGAGQANLVFCKQGTLCYRING